MTLWERIILDELRNYHRYIFAVKEQIPSELETLRSQLNMLKASNTEKMPSGSENHQEDAMLSVISKIDLLEREMKCRQKQIDDTERKLARLDKDERKVIERLVIKKGSAEDLAIEMGYTVRQVYYKRSDALLHLAQMSGAE